MDIDSKNSYVKMRNPIETFVNLKFELIGFFVTKTKNLEDAKDLYQELFIRASKGLSDPSKFENDNALKSWIYTIANNLFIDFWRKKRKRLEFRISEKNPVLQFIGSADKNVEEKMIQKECEDLAYQAWLRLCPPLRRTAYLRAQGKSFNEISEIENCGINTALGRMRYAKINMKKNYLVNG